MRTYLSGTKGVVGASVATPYRSDFKNTMNNSLSPLVQMQFLRPAQFEKAARAFPVAYVPLGLIEWHGGHLPLGTDCLKAHALLVKCAEKYGGLVYPPVYFPSSIYAEGEFQGADKTHKVPLFTDLFQSLKAAGFRVIVVVSGHNTLEQLQMINYALAPVTDDGVATGVGLWEVSLNDSDDVGTDHAAKWETSDIMFFYPALVDLGELDARPLSTQGVDGIDPRQEASPEVGQRKAELVVDALGEKARELLLSLPAEHRRFNLPSFDSQHWWQI